MHLLVFVSVCCIKGSDSLSYRSRIKHTHTAILADSLRRFLLFPFSQSLLFYLSLSRRHPSFFFHLSPFFSCPILFFSLSFLFSTLLPLVSFLFHSLLHLISILSFFPSSSLLSFFLLFLSLALHPSIFLPFLPSFFLSYSSYTFLPLLFSPIFFSFSISSDEYIRIQYTKSIIRYSTSTNCTMCLKILNLSNQPRLRQGECS